MQIGTFICACGSDNIFALSPGADEIREHPRDIFGLPDLRQTPVVSVPEISTVARCMACATRLWRGLNRVEAACG